MNLSKKKKKKEKANLIGKRTKAKRALKI